MGAADRKVRAVTLATKGRRSAVKIGLLVSAQGVVMSVRTSLPHEDDLRLAAQSHVPVLISAGRADDRATSARMIHDNSVRGLGPFVIFERELRCADVTPSTESDDSGADAVRLRHRFEEARGGTLFIDDVTELSAALQRQLFLLLEEAVTQVDPTGQRTSSGVRILAGASRALDDALAANTFFEPLFYRLNIIHVDSLMQPEPTTAAGAVTSRPDVGSRA